ncbi:glycosyl transferase [Shewanella hanedai]|nr:glycosyltransferase family 25 protein [Shewanella hanedai]GGI77447.1 glycosyl transferase [Shewanella hanedai]
MLPVYINYSFDGKMKFNVMVINLDSSTDRWESMTKQCDLLGLSPQRVSAVRGSLLSEKEKSDVYQLSSNLSKYDKILNDGEIGCYMSHIRCWELIVEQQLDFALVLEDDAILTEDMAKYVDKLAHTSSDWDYIKLSHGSKIKSAVDCMDLGDGLTLKKVLKLPSTTTGQLISLSGAKRLLSHAYPIARPIDMDIQYWFEKSLRCFVVSPFPILNGDFGSEINKTGDRRIVKKRPIRRILQKIRYEILLWCNRSKLPEFPKL